MYGNYCMYAPPLPSSPPFFSPPIPSPLFLPSLPLPAFAVHDPQWYAVFTSQLTPEHTQLVQEMLAVAAYRKQYKGQGGWSGVRGEEGCVRVLCDGKERKWKLQLFHILVHCRATHSTQHTTPSQGTPDPSLHPSLSLFRVQ